MLNQRNIFFLATIALIFLTNIMAQTSPTNSPKPPATQKQPVTNDYFGHKVVDNYQWLEDATSPATEQWVAQQLAYTRGILDKLPGREQLHARLSQLLQIGNLGGAEVGGDYYFHTRREGTQNQPVLYVRKGVDGKDEVLVDVNTLSKDGTTALDWWVSSHDGRYVAYGTSEGGSEISTLHIIETATKKLLPDTIERTRAASLAWMPDDSGFYYTRYPKPGDVAAGQEMYNRHVFYHALGSDAAKDPLIFGEGRDPQDWPNVTISNDGRWLAIMVEKGWTKTELYLIDTRTNSYPFQITDGKEFVYAAQPYNGALYILTNDGAPRYHVYRAPLPEYHVANHGGGVSLPRRSHWREIIPQTDAVLTSAPIIGGQLFARYEQNAHSLLRRFELDGKPLGEIALPTLGTITSLGGDYDSTSAFYLFSSFTMPTTLYRFDIASSKSSVWDSVETGFDTNQYETKQVWYASKDGTRIPMFLVMQERIEADRHTLQHCSPATAASMSA